MQAGVLPLLGLDDALDAIEASVALPIDVAQPITARLAATDSVMLDEAASKRALAAYGVIVPPGRLAHSPDGAADAAEACGYPVVLKAVGAALMHKTEMGAVRLNLRDAAAVREAAASLAGLSDAILVERMVTDAVAEVIVGIARDPAIGPYLVLGSGGVLAELVGDTAILLLPASEAAIREALAGLKVAKLLAGYRGKPAGDVDALVRAVLGVQDYAIAMLGRLLELDVNPVMVRPAGLGAVAADALIRLAREAT